MRLQGVDIARFVAFFGMVLVNFRIAAEVTTQGGWGGANVDAGSVVDWPALITGLTEGRAAALFVILAGVGFALGNPAWHLTLRRALFLFAVGMADMLIFDADILHFYALYFLVGALFIGASNRVLLLGVAGFVVIGALAQAMLTYDQGWNWDTLVYADFWTLTGFLRHTFYNGWHPVFPWAAFVLFGIWLGRQSLSRAPVQITMLIVGVTVAFVTQWASTLLVELPELGELLGTTPIPPGVLYMVASAATATAVLGGILLLTPLLTLLRLDQILIAPGRMTLTLYAAHILIGMGLLESMDLLSGQLSSFEIFAYSVGFVTCAALFALFWLRKFRRGPLEALMRIVTEGKT